MGVAKTKLMRGDRYSLLAAAELIAKMVGDFERGRSGTHSIRVESLDDPLWDDIKAVDEAALHKWQVKRLAAPLPSEAATKLLRSAATQDQTTPVAMHLAVANFVPIVTGGNTDCGLHELSNLCAEARKSGLVSADFAKTVKSDAAYQFVQKSLPDLSAASLVSTLKTIHVVELGNEEQIRIRSATHLVDFFSNPEELVEHIHNWLLQHSDGSVEISVGIINREVLGKYGQRDATRPRWLRLARSAGAPQWELCGSLEHSSVVQTSWEQPGRARVQLAAPPYRGEDVSVALSRLALHCHGTTILEATHPDVWRRHAHELCGGTLGLRDTPPELTITALAPAAPHPSMETITSDRLASGLSAEMDRTVWRDYVSNVDSLINSDPIAEDLRAHMRVTWNAWLTTLESHPRHQIIFLEAMLTTTSERNRNATAARVRLGCLLLGDLSRSTIIALAVASAFIASGVQVEIEPGQTVDHLRIGSMSAHVVAILAAQHPLDGASSIISRSPGHMLSAEKGITILARVEASSADIHSFASGEFVSFSASETASDNFRQPGPLTPCLTASLPLTHAMRSSLAHVQQHIAAILGQAQNERLRALRTALETTQP